MQRLRNRVSATILVGIREISEETRFLEIMHNAKAEKPGFCDNFGLDTRDIGRNPVSGDYAKAKKPGFFDNFGWVTRYLARNPVSGDYAILKH